MIISKLTSNLTAFLFQCLKNWKELERFKINKNGRKEKRSMVLQLQALQRNREQEPHQVCLRGVQQQPCWGKLVQVLSIN